ncbi:MAG: hypothetical protein DMF63_08935 [Acidobacteria bacterium]|nr:MAG: hypothetical protein DMF63_08935 [Acidobacteriota bacterium]
MERSGTRGDEGDGGTSSRMRATDVRRRLRRLIALLIDPPGFRFTPPGALCLRSLRELYEVLDNGAVENL